MIPLRPWVVFIVVGLAVGPGNASIAVPEDPIQFSEVEARRIRQHSPLGEVPPDPTNRFADDLRAAHLGQFLFFDERLSRNGEIACATCHDPAQGFVDGKELAQGIETLRRHTPSLWNVGYNRWFFWDGRADSLWSQALEPLEHPDEMAGTRLTIVRHLCEDPELRVAYHAVFGDLPDITGLPARARPVPEQPEHAEQRAWMSIPIARRVEIDRTFANVGKALAAYQRKLVSRNSPFDAYVAAGLGAERPEGFSDAAERGLRLFVGKANCRLCHSGPNFTDGEFHNTMLPPLNEKLRYDAARFEGVDRLLGNPFNAVGPYSDDRRGQKAELTRSIRKTSETWGAFKTPTLRNVARTAPYMHQGQMKTLKEVVKFYSTLENASGIGHHQETVLVPLDLTDAEIDDLVAFLESLTDPGPDPVLLKPPKSPRYGP